MEIIELRVQDSLRYNELALSHGTIFDTFDWTNIFRNYIYRYGIYDNGDRLIGGFILYKEKKFGLSIYRNLPFTPYMGPFLQVEASNPVSIMDTWKKVLSKINDLIDNLGYSIVSISLNKNIIDMQPFIWGKFKVIPIYTYLLDLSLSQNDLLSRMSNERRKNINRGLKDKLIVLRSKDYEIIKSLVLKTFTRQKKQISEHYLGKILFEFANENNSYAFVTFKNDHPIACSFCIYDRDTAYYLLGGYDYEDKHHGAGVLCILESIKYASKIGLKIFDFEGSMIQPVEKYMRGFGGTLTPYFTINKAKLPLEILLKFIKREMF